MSTSKAKGSLLAIGLLAACVAWTRLQAPIQLPARLRHVSLNGLNLGMRYEQVKAVLARRPPAVRSLGDFPNASRTRYYYPDGSILQIEYAGVYGTGPTMARSIYGGVLLSDDGYPVLRCDSVVRGLTLEALLGRPTRVRELSQGPGHDWPSIYDYDDLDHLELVVTLVYANGWRLLPWEDTGGYPVRWPDRAANRWFHIQSISMSPPPSWSINGIGERLEREYREGGRL